MNSKDELRLEEIDRLIHEPARLSIMICLSILREADFTFLIYKTKLSRGNLSVQLQNLEAAGYIDISKQFVNRVPRTMASITDEGQKALRLYKSHMMYLLGSVE